MRIVCVAVVALSLLAGCARQVSSSVYSGRSVETSSEACPGVISNIRAVTIEENETLADNSLGAIGGGVAGALLGSQVGKGKGSTLGLVGGTLLGATAGAFAQKSLSQQEATEYLVTLENGRISAVIQAYDPSLSIGQKVYLIIGERGRARITSRN